jgi:hypothetical protein
MIANSRLSTWVSTFTQQTTMLDARRSGADGELPGHGEPMSAA